MNATNDSETAVSIINRQINHLNFIRVWNLFRQYSHLYAIVATIRLLLLCYPAFIRVLFFFFHSSIPNGAHSNAPSHPFSETLFQAILFNKQPHYSLTATRREQQQTRKWYRSNSNAQRKKNG